MNDVMVDLETLGTVASSVIMSIGAVRFDLETGKVGDDGFYASISIDSNTDAGRQISEDTLIWWMGQSPEARRVFNEPKQSLQAALESFSDWFDEHKTPDKVRIWSNGADFDLPMLVHAYHLFGWDAPWKFYNSRCARTYKNLPQAAIIERPQRGVAHNALSDALNQALHVCAIHQALTGRKERTAA